MSFVHPLLLGGLLLVGIPVLIHLIMQQKPKRLLFPAFRFLVLKHRTNQRRLRLRHWLLLALRIALIAAICLALARPKLFSNRLGIGSDRPVAAVLLFDTSLSMGYQVSKQTRLDEAKKRALELLESLPADSRIAVFDSAEPGGDWLTRPEAEKRITELKLRPVNAAVTRQIGQAYRLLKELDQEQSDASEAMPRILCVFSDRTQACWDANEAKALHPPEGLNTVFVDVGVDAPADIGLVDVDVPRQTVHPGDRAEIRVTVRSVGLEGENDLVWLREGDTAVDKQPVRLAAGGREEKRYERAAGAAPDDPENKAGRLLPGLFHQFIIRLDAGDSMPFNDKAFATVKVQEGRQILIVTDNPGKSVEKGDAWQWLRALRVSHQFPCEVRSTAEAEGFGRNQLNDYEAVCLLNVAKPSEELWRRLETYVRGGKGLAVVLGGKDWLPSLDDYNKDPGRAILGVNLVQQKDVGDDDTVKWRELETDMPKASLHPLVRYFRERHEAGNLTEENLPRARFYWNVKPDPGRARPVATFTDKENSPALLEHRFGKGRVLLFTTALDGHKVRNLDANNYLSSWFGMALMINATGYLAGDAETPNFNFICGQTVTVPVPTSPTLVYRLFGPDAAGVNVPRAKGENELRITQAVQPGNYAVFDPTTEKRVASFSLNSPPEESQLDRVPVEQIESLLGAGTVLAVDRGSSLADAIQGHLLQPIELFPWLMILVLLVLAVENLLANKFYKRGAQEEAPARLAASLGEPSEKAPERALAEARG
jgi:hypothetical protein